MKVYGWVLVVLALCTCPAYGVPAINEDFETGVPPAGWTVVDNAGQGVVWTTNVAEGRNNDTGGSGMAAHCDSDNYLHVPYDTELISPAFLVPANGDLQFDTYFKTLVFGEVADVDITTDGGSNWINLLHWETEHGPYEHVTLPLGAYAGQNAQVRFHYYNPVDFQPWDWYWQVDDVVIATAGGGGGGSAIPEPAGVGLAAIGGLLFVRRRRA
jgi:MYXO-CTERM domain-containing protein